MLELALGCGVLLYVIDVREPVLEKYKDELAVLASSARPIIAVLNFVAADDSRESEWRDALARVTLHTVVAFDARVRSFKTELQLYKKIASQLNDSELAIQHGSGIGAAKSGSVAKRRVRPSPPCWWTPPLRSEA